MSLIGGTKAQQYNREAAKPANGRTENKTEDGE